MLGSEQKLTGTHSPDLLRMPELFAIVTILLLVFFAKRKRMTLIQAELIMALSFFMAPFVVFNQQIITGRSLQPFHFQMFISNYVVLVGVALGVLVILRAVSWNKNKTSKVAVWIILASLWWASIELLIHTKVILKENSFS